MTESEVGELEHPDSSVANTRRAALATEHAARIELEKREERAFVASVRKSVSNSGTLNLHLKNPSGSGKDCNLASIKIDTQFQATYTVHDDFSSAPSGGSTVAVENLLLDTNNGKDSGNMAVNKDVSFTADSQHLLGVVPSGGNAGAIGGDDESTQPLIQPEREIVIEVTNEGAKAGKAAIRVVYTEETG